MPACRNTPLHEGLDGVGTSACRHAAERVRRPYDQVYVWILLREALLGEEKGVDVWNKASTTKH
jgi:hypothetical protein